MSPDDESADSDPLSRPDPTQRPWRHPSELPRPVPMTKRTAPPRIAMRRSSAFSWLFASAVTGSLATIGVLAVCGAFGTATGVRTARFDAQDRSETRSTVAALRAAMFDVAPLSSAARPVIALCINKHGDLLTTAAAVGSANTVAVTDAAGKQHTATVIGVDAHTGLALVRVQRARTWARLASSGPTMHENVRIVGRSSYTHRGSVDTTEGVAVDTAGFGLPNLIRTNALSTLADPGSVMVDDSGRVVAVVIDGERGAVPIDYAMLVAQRLAANGTADHAWLGIHARGATDGPRVTRVDDSSPAHRAGLQPGDVIEAIDDRRVTTMTQLQALIRWRWAHDAMRFSVLRDGARLTVTLTADSKPAEKS